MKLKIDPQIFEKFPQLQLGVVIAKNIDNSRKTTTTQQLLNGICAQRAKKLTKETLGDEPKIQIWRDAYKTFGAKPKKHPSSIEALLKRVVEGDSIPQISTLVDLYNYISLKNIIPVGGEDLDQICGDVHLTLAEGTETFTAIRSKKVEKPEPGEVIYRDALSATCRRWNYRECDRTKFTKETKNACIIAEDLGLFGKEKLTKILEDVKQYIQKYCGGEAEIHILSFENPEVETGVEGQPRPKDEDAPVTKTIEEAEKKDEKTEPQKSKPAAPKKKPATSGPIVNPAHWNEKIRLMVKEAVKKAYPEETTEVRIEYPRSADHGDYACSIALPIARKLQQPPRMAAQKIINALPEEKGIEKIEIAGPGFINFFLSDKTLDAEIKKINKKREVYGESLIGDDRTIIVEYSQPNIAKPLGIHHLLSTVFGQIIANLYRTSGFNTIGINHIGDWGTQFGKLIHAYKTWGNKEKIEEEGIMGLLELYVKFHDEVEEEKKKEEQPETTLEDLGRAEFKKLEDGDEENRRLWKWFIEITMKEIQPIYHTLGIKFNETMGESFYEDKMAPLLEKGKAEGIFTVGEKGALVAEFEGEKMPTCVIQKADGASLYATRDIATVEYRVNRWAPEKIVYVVDVAQSLHFKQFFDIAERLGVKGDTELTHVQFGRMRLPDASMSTRKGNVILLSKVLQEAVTRARAIIAEKSPHLTEQEQKRIAQHVGIGAIKYNVLSQNRTTNITFDWDKMLAFEGNSAPYLQYTTARANSILQKKEDEKAQKQANPDNVLRGQTSLLEYAEPQKEEEEGTQELALKRMLIKYSEALLDATRTHKPNILCTYLYELAQQFNAFYNSSRVLNAAPNTQERRLTLVRASRQILSNGLKVLGIEPLEKM